MIPDSSGGSRSCSLPKVIKALFIDSYWALIQLTERALAATRAGVDYLVSEDKDLTAVDETTAELRRHIQPLISGTFLRQVMGWSHEELEAVRGRAWDEVEG